MRRYSVLTLHDLLGITAGTSDLGLVYEGTGDAQRLRDGILSSSSLAIQMVQHKRPQGIWSEMPHRGVMCRRGEGVYIMQRRGYAGKVAKVASRSP